MSFASKRVWIGNTARAIPPEERTHPDLTHAWTVYVRPEDPSFVSSVTFRLHESFLNNVVEKTFPFEVSEQGWGEFSVGIRIHTPLGSVATAHFLRLHSTEGAERFDEIAFPGPQNDRAPSDEEAAEYRNIERAIEAVLAKLSRP